MSKHQIVQIGTGPLGLKMIKMAVGRRTCGVIAAVDNAPDLVGRDLGEISGIGISGIRIRASIEEVVAEHRPDIAVVTTVSDLQKITPLLLSIVEHRIHVVSTCEELSYCWDVSPDLAAQIDQAAKRAGVAVLGTGVNPGFLMDSLPAFLTGVCESVEKIEVLRFQDAQHRRVPFQKKIGAGLTLEEFAQKKAAGTLRHVGLTESMQFIAARLGWKLDSTRDDLSPVIARKDIETAATRIREGYASGVRQVGSAFVKGAEKIRLVFQAAVGEPESFDEVRITGNPPIVSRIDRGVNGDIATCAITLNAIPSVLNARPGLRTMADVPMVSCQG